MKLDENSSGYQIAQQLEKIRLENQRNFEFLFTCLGNEELTLKAGKIQMEQGWPALIDFINSDQWQPSKDLSNW